PGVSLMFQSARAYYMTTFNCSDHYRVKITDDGFVEGTKPYTVYIAVPYRGKRAMGADAYALLLATIDAYGHGNAEVVPGVVPNLMKAIIFVSKKHGQPIDKVVREGCLYGKFAAYAMGSGQLAKYLILV